MDRRTAASLDRWLTSPPWQDERDEDEYNCEECGEPLPLEADARRDEEHIRHCDGQPVSDDHGNVWSGCETFGWLDVAVAHEPHDEVMAVTTIETRNCRKCGAANVDASM